MSKMFFANWKTYLSDDEAEALARAYAACVASPANVAPVDIIVAPSFTALERVHRVLAGSPIALGAQDVFWNDEGAHTGEIIPKQLAMRGVRSVLVGHSERRALGETNETVARKADAAAAAGMTPVLCVGETKEERNAGNAETVVRAQLNAVLDGWAANKGLVIAYEPRWAIGSGTPCRPEDVEVMHGVIASAMRVSGLPPRVLYGGSVDPSNAAAYLALESVAGLLVGGASTRVNGVCALIDLFSR